VQELQEVVRYSREDAVKHQERSRAIINSLNKTINSLEEIAIEFILHEQTDQNLISKLKAVVEKDRMSNLMSKLNEDDYQVTKSYFFILE
jgi:DNA-directed RNA polymerase sigma subunit (sigma70/sigma32)